jgi:ABC-type nitrate/sulfonate/bicarbonate transport system ATPase subunit
MSLVLQHVTKSFAARRGSAQQDVLRGVELEVRAGEFVSLIGHSGCGKSTLLNVGPGPDRAVVFQNYSLLPRLSLLANVREAARAAHPQQRARAGELAERYLTAVGLWEHRNKRPHEVSGGMQQRTAVARAFAVEPRILLLDEPFGALDALTRARLQAQLLDLWQSESKTETVLMVTHGIEEAIYLADRIVVMGNPPGPTIIDEIPVPLARPRNRAALLDDPSYHDVYNRLMELLAAEDVSFN